MMIEEARKWIYDDSSGKSCFIVNGYMINLEHGCASCSSKPSEIKTIGGYWKSGAMKCFDYFIAGTSLYAFSKF